MSDKKPVNDDDLSMFRDAVGDVKPVANDRHPSTTAKPAARVKSQQQDNQAVMHELMSDFSDFDLLETGEHLSWTAPGIQHAELRKLKQGKHAIRAEIDLHGMTRDQAHRALSDFLGTAQMRDHRCVRVIHGKGRKVAERSPVLKKSVDGWLRHHKQVLAFCSARDNDGGTGAVYVLLRKAR